MTLESDQDWRSQFEYLQTLDHVFVGDESDLPRCQWGVVFVDGRTEDRPRHIQYFLDHAMVVVVHDAEDTINGYAQAVEVAPYKILDKSRVPWTAMLSKYPLIGNLSDERKEHDLRR